jgi:hypothetical protein
MDSQVTLTGRSDTSTELTQDWVHWRALVLVDVEIPVFLLECLSRKVGEIQ